MSSFLPASVQHDEIFLGDGEMAQLMRAHPWESTPLGAPAGWPNALKVAVRMLLSSRFEMWLGWGPDIAFFYNDAYRPTLGIKHPQSLATPTQVLWSEIWHDIEPRLRTVYERGEATWDRALLLLLHRNGYPEETYHTFSYSPLVGETGQVEGVFCAVTEETERVISERRMGSLRELASALTTAHSRATVLAAAEKTLAQNPRDLPVSLIYLFAEDGSAVLAGVTGIDLGHPLAPETLLPLGGPWDLRAIFGGASHQTVDLSPTQVLPSGAWDRAPTHAVLVPLPGQGTSMPRGALLIGVNPYRAVDKDYLAFLQLLAGQLASSLAGAEAHEAEQQRAEALADAVRLRQEAADVLRQVNVRLLSEVRIRTAERDRLRGLFQQAPSFMCLLQGPDHVFELVNEAYLQLVGHRSLIGLAIRDALPEIAGQGYFELLDEVYRSGKPFIGNNLQVQLQRSPGSALERCYVNVVYQPIVDSEGAVTGIFVDGHDVTHHKQTEEALQALNETLEQRVAERTEKLAETLAKLQRESAEREAAQNALRHAGRPPQV